MAQTKKRLGKIKNAVASRLLRITTAVTKAVQHRIEEETTQENKIILFKRS